MGQDFKINNNKIKRQLDKMVKEKVFSGATFALIYKNNIEMGTVGSKAIYPIKEPNDITTLYDISSLTKVIVTNTIISKLISLGIISLGDKVSSYLHKFKFDNITIYDLLTHSSGLPADFDVSNIKDKEELIDKIYNIPLEYETGSKAVYSDIGFILLGFIIEDIYGMSLDKVANQEVFKPLGMKSTCFKPENKMKCAPTENTKDRGLVRGTVHDEKADLLEGVAGNAGVFSNVLDLTNYCRMILNDGYVDGEQYLPKEIIDSWSLPYTKTDFGIQRGIGWQVGRYDALTGDYYNDTMMTHTGFTGTSILIDRENGIACILLTNRVHPSRENTLLVRRRKEFTKACYEFINEKEQEMNRQIIKK